MAERKKTTRARPRSNGAGQAARDATSRENAPWVLVTGASGFLGRHLVAVLVARGRRVRALVRQPSLWLERHATELVLGDVCDAAVCARAVDGAAEIYHAAGLVSRDPKDGPTLYKVHVEGTRALLQAAAQAKARRVVVVSTSGTVAVSKDPDEVSDETRPYRHAEVANWPYYLSKIYQEQTALELGRRLGLEVVVVCPSLLLGPGDTRRSSTGDVEKLVRGRVPFVPKGGGVAFVDARDAADACVAAMARGRAFERYLVSASNMTLEAFAGRVARLAQVTTPRAVHAPQGLRVATRLAEALYRRFDREPPLDLASVEMAQHTWYVDADKARRELGFTPRDPATTLADTVRDIRGRLGLERAAPQ